MKSDLTPETIKKYIESLKILENSQKKGFNKGKWYPYDSLEGGNDTTAYGHKITGKEGIDFYKGITEPQATQLLEKDIIEHQKLAKEYIDAIYGKGKFDSLSQDRQMLLTDYVFNGVQLSGFPLFTKGTLENNKETMLNEYKRYYKDKNGVTKPLIERNNWTKNVIENMLDNSNNESSKYTSPYNISPNYNYSLPLDNLRVNKQNQYLFKSGGVLRDPTKPYHPINNPDGYGKPIIVNPNDPAGRQRYQSYQDSLVTYNNAQLYNRDLRNLIDQNLADGASRTHDPYYTTGMFSSYGYSSKNDAEKAKNKFKNDQDALARKYRLTNNLNPYNHTVDFFNDWFLYYHHPPIASPSGQGYFNSVGLNPEEAAFPKPQEVIYDTTPPDPPQPEPQPPTRKKINISSIPVKYNTTYSPPPLDPSKFKRPAIKPTSPNKNLYIQFKDPNQSTRTSQEIINFDDWGTYKEFNDALQNAGRFFSSSSSNQAKTQASASYGGLTKKKAMEIYKEYTAPKSSYRTGGIFKDPPVNPTPSPVPSGVNVFATSNSIYRTPNNTTANKPVEYNPVYKSLAEKNFTKQELNAINNKKPDIPKQDKSAPKPVKLTPFEQKVLEKEIEAQTLGQSKVTFNQFGEPVIKWDPTQPKASGKIEPDYMDPITMAATFGAGAYGLGYSLPTSLGIAADNALFNLPSLGKGLGKATFKNIFRPTSASSSVDDKLKRLKPNIQYDKNLFLKEIEDFQVKPYDSEIDWGKEYFAKIANKQKEIGELLHFKKINYKEYKELTDQYAKALQKSLGLGQSLGNGNYAEVLEVANKPTIAVKLGEPYGNRWTPELIEKLKSVKQNANIAIPERVEYFKIPSLYPETKEVITMPNLNQVAAENLNLNKRDRYAYFLKQARQLRDKGIKLDIGNMDNIQFNKNKGVFDIYDVNPGNIYDPVYYMQWIKDETKGPLFEDMSYKQGGPIYNWAGALGAGALQQNKQEYGKGGLFKKKGGKMIKRADGSYSQRGLWDNIRANKGSGKKPTKQMLEQERKIKNK